MSDLTPRTPVRPLIWPDTVLDMSDALTGAGQSVYAVGGAVRDAYLHRPVKDLDLAVRGDAIGFARRITNLLKGDIFVMDQERGVSRVFTETPQGRLVIDVTRFRGDDLLADLQDRDFTINAMAVDLKAPDQLIDPLNGEADIAAKRIRRCSPHAIESDPIRALRAVRQSSQLNMRIEPETLRDVRQYGPRMVETSAERVRDEFFNLLNLRRPAAALRVTATLGLLEHILPDVKPLYKLEQAAPHIHNAWEHTLLVIEKLAQMIDAISPRRTDQTAAVFDLGMLVMQLDRYRRDLQVHLDQTWANDRPHRALLVLAALLHNAGKPDAAPPDFAGHVQLALPKVAERADALRLSGDEKKRLLAIVGHYRTIQDVVQPTPLDLHRFWYPLGAAGIDACLMGLADYLGTVGNYLQQDDWLVLVERAIVFFDAYFDQHDKLVRPPVLLNGQELMEQLGLQPGPHMGQLLQTIREAQVVGAVQTPEEALNLARRSLDDR